MHPCIHLCFPNRDRKPRPDRVVPYLSSPSLTISLSHPQAKWFHPTTGTHLASCGSDRLLRIFTHDPSAAPLSGRSFPPTAQITSKTSAPFVSLDIHTTSNIYTHLAAIDRSGLLTVFVPDTPDRFNEWKVLAKWPVVSPPPGNGEETSFKVRWDPNLESLAYTASLTDHRHTLRLLVTAMDSIKVYHALPLSAAGGATGEGIVGAASATTHFHLVASLTPFPGVLIRDAAWASFNVRGVDLLATASRNGAVSIIEMSHGLNAEGLSDMKLDGRAGEGNASANANDKAGGSSFPRQPSTSTSTSTRQISQSHLSTAIAGRQNKTNTPLPPSSASRSHPSPSPLNPLPYTTHLSISTTIPSAHADAWSIAWDPSGQVLMSNGSEGRTSMWKKSILEGEWREFSSVEFEVGDEDDGNEEEEGWMGMEGGRGEVV
jgi:nucleoporin SEH1